MHQAQLQGKIECKEQMKLLLICDELRGPSYLLEDAEPYFCADSILGFCCSFNFSACCWLSNRSINAWPAARLAVLRYSRARVYSAGAWLGFIRRQVTRFCSASLGDSRR